MSKKQVIIKAALCALLAVTGKIGYAGGGGGVVFDPTNYAQNLISAKEAVKEVRTGLEQLKVQYEQYDTLVKQVKSLDPHTMNMLLNGMPMPDEVKNLAKVLVATQSLNGNIESVQKAFQFRLDESRLRKMTWQKYLEQEAARIANRESAAIARVRAEKHAMQRIEQDYEFIRDQSDRIPKSAGVHESMQQLNVQMNRMLQQNAELLRAVALAQGSQAAEEQIRAAEKETRAITASDEINEKIRSVETSGSESFRNWLNKGK